MFCLNEGSKIVNYYSVMVCDSMKTKVLVVGLEEIDHPLYEVTLKSGKFEIYGYA